MLHGNNLILATRPYAKEDLTTSWLATLSTLLLVGIGFAGALAPLPLFVRIPCSLVTGLLLVRLFVIYHDYLHGTILKKSPIAKALFTVFGLYILAPTSIWKRSHDYHHKHNSKLYSAGIGSFPIVTRENFFNLPKGQRNSYLFSRHPLTIGFGYLFAFAFGMCTLSLVRNPSKHWDSAIALVFHFGIAATVFITMGWLAFVLGILIPSLVAGALGTYLFYAQHNFPDVVFQDKEGWTYMGAALKSSSYMTMNPVMHWFTANIGYHHIHHTNAKIPFYRLKEVYAKFPEFQDAKTTKLTPREIMRCLRLKIWCPDSNRMLSVSEARQAA